MIIPYLSSAILPAFHYAVPDGHTCIFPAAGKPDTMLQQFFLIWFVFVLPASAYGFNYIIFILNLPL